MEKGGKTGSDSPSNWKRNDRWIVPAVLISWDGSSLMEQRWLNPNQTPVPDAIERAKIKTLERPPLKNYPSRLFSRRPPRLKEYS
jgi:hypothetical protein